MTSLEGKTLALFFTKGVSLQGWDRMGILSRELALYEEVAPSFRRIFFFTYGNAKDKTYQQRLPENVTVIPQLFPFPALLYSFLLPLLQWKKLKETHILKTNQMLGSWSAVLAKMLYGKKLVVRCGYEWLEVMERRETPFWKRKIAAFLELISYRVADVAVFSNEEDKEYARKRFHLSPHKLVVVPNFVDTEQFTTLSVQKEKGRVIFVGKLEEQKNVFQLIEAVATLDVRLVIIGEGSLRSRLEECAKKKQAPVEFWGSIPHERLPEELNKSELFVLPSLYEGHPKALLEAMSCGLPCIGTSVKGIDAVIEHKKNGYLCELSVESIREAIKTVLQDKELQGRMGREARKSILTTIGLEQIVSNELELYGQLI